jgi:hypothetical protein
MGDESRQLAVPERLQAKPEAHSDTGAIACDHYQDTGAIACDHYQRVDADLDLLAGTGLTA